MTDTLMSQGSYGAPYENGTAGPGSMNNMAPSSLPSLNTAQAPGVPLATNGLASPTSATSAGGQVRRAAPEPNKRALYVGGLDQRVTEDVLRQIFETAGQVQNVKIIPDKNFQSKGLNYGFVEYEDPMSAERAMQSLNGRTVLANEIRVNWAYQSNNTSKEDTSNHHHIFVGDLSNEVNDEVLLQAFSIYGGVSEARVMWDMKTGRSRGYGFVAFRNRDEAQKALDGMNGEFLGSRAIRCNWANQKGQPSVSQHQAMVQMGMTPPGYPPQQQAYPPQNNMANYQTVLAQAEPWVTTVYIGNITTYTGINDLVPLFQSFGYVGETRFNSDRGFAFIKMDTHENAANAICSLQGYQINGRPMRLNWGKEGAGAKPAAPNGQYNAFSPPAGQPAYGQQANYFPQYAQPQSNSQYGQGAYGQYQAGHYSRTPATHGHAQYGGYGNTAAYGYPQGSYSGYQQ